MRESIEEAVRELEDVVEAMVAQVPAVTERDLQRAVAQYLSWALRRDAIAFHVPNERANAAEAKRLAAEGVLPGVADWIILAPGAIFGGRYAHGFAIELKTPTGRQSQAQRNFESDCKRIKVPYAVCRSLDEVEATLHEWGLLHESVRLG